MKLAVFHNQPSGGARRALHGFCRRLRDRHRLDIFTLTSADQEMLSDEAVAHQVRRFEFRQPPPVRLGLYINDLRQLAGLDALERVNERAAAEIDASRYDAVLVDECRYTLAPDILRHLRTPAAYYCHHRLRKLNERPWAPPKSLYVRARRLWHLPFERQFERRVWQREASNLRAARVIFTNSEYNRCQLGAIHGLDARVCPPGVDLPPAHERNEQHYVLSVGALEAHKGFDFLISALSLITAERRPPLVIAANDGNVELERRLRDLAAKLGVDLRIRMRPLPERLAELYADSLVFLYAPLGEPLGLAALEAMSFGTPVLAVRDAGVRETVGDAGMLVERNPRVMAASLARLLASRDLRTSLGNRGREHVATNWNWESKLVTLERELEALAESGEPRR